MHQRILIIDNGSQYAQLVARSIRSAGVYCEIQHAALVSNQFLQQYATKNLRGIVITGQHSSANQAINSEIFNLGVPVLGIAYGMHAIAANVAAQAASANNNTIGSADGPLITSALVRARGHTKLLNGIQDYATEQGHGMLNAGFMHGPQLTELPEGFILMASSELCPIAGIANEEQQIYGLQFHPELNQTTQGNAILHRFAHEICGCDFSWNMAAYVDELVEKIRQQAGNDEVILGLSGGVDSSVVAALIHKAIGSRLTCVFVDHGLLRLNEAKQVMNMFGSSMGINIVHVDASEQFMSKLKGVTDPEAKRKIIGAEFIEVFQSHAQSIPTAKWLAQGTIYPDVIESINTKAGGAVAVKSHHNVGGLPETLNLKLLEPIRELFKDEVRELGLALGLPPSMVYRHPFPGPGIGVRILGEIKSEYADILRQADAIFIEELQQTTDEKTGKTWYELTSQAFAVFVPVKSVGVNESGRVYEYVIALRAVVTVDFMTAAWAELPYSLLNRASNRIIKEVDGVSRVVYDISGKPPATIEWE